MTEQDEQLIAFERQYPELSLAKDLEIWGRFGMSSASYYERLDDLIDDVEAGAFDPKLLDRLRRQRNVRRAFGLVEGFH